MVALIAQGKINGKLAKDIFPKMAAADEAPEVIMQREGLESISDEGALGKIIDEVIAANPKQVEQYKSGKQQVIGFPGGPGDESQPRAGGSGGGQSHVEREVVSRGSFHLRKPISLRSSSCRSFDSCGPDRNIP